MKVEVIKTLQEGGRVDPSDLLDALEPYFPLIYQMGSTPQDAEWHAEGNVRIHTEMVIAEAYKVVADHGLKGDLALALILSAALHDVGKALVTREEKQQGRIRITSPRHAARGRSYVALRISELGLKQSVRDLVMAGIGHHHDPRKLVSRRKRSNGKYWRLARIVDPWFIYLLEIADIKGRISHDGGESALDVLGLFKLSAEEAGVWRVDDPYSDWCESIHSSLLNLPEKSRDYVFHEARRFYENDEIYTPEEAIAKTYANQKEFPELVVTCGPSGSGKSSWIAENLPDHREISLDDLRIELTGKRSNMSKDGQVMQLAKERLREALREKAKIVWSATSLREDGRAGIIGLGHDYHAHTRIVAFGAHPDELMLRNQKREHQIRSKVIEQQLDRLQWPNAWEAHVVEYVYS